LLRGKARCLQEGRRFGRSGEGVSLSTTVVRRVTEKCQFAELLVVDQTDEERREGGFTTKRCEVSHRTTKRGRREEKPTVLCSTCVTLPFSTVTQWDCLL
jgi:hypothetical protein